MNKTVMFVLLVLIAVFSFGKVSSFANESENVKQLRFNNTLRIDDDSSIFEISGEGKNKTQFRIKDNHNDENAEFKLKGTISATSSDSITIDGKVVNIDSAITEEVKIVGKLEVGAYAMAKGVVIDSDLYAEQIVVNQRNKNEIEEENEIEDEDQIDEDEDENATLSATPTPTLTEDEDEDATMTAQLDFGNIINAIQNFLNYLIGIASKI